MKCSRCNHHTGTFDPPHSCIYDERDQLLKKVNDLGTRLSDYRKVIRRLGGSICEECGLAFPDTNNFGFCSEDCRKKHGE